MDTRKTQELNNFTNTLSHPKTGKAIVAGYNNYVIKIKINLDNPHNGVPIAKIMNYLNQSSKNIMIKRAKKTY